MSKASKKKSTVAYARPLVLPETDALMQIILVQDKAKAEKPHKITLIDLWHEAALALRDKRESV